ncbi:MAG: hypothetical protein J7L89_06100 [Bacteroidales bacterium]|nr:hypothetical protein [Bacteroidales bacterium]
MKRRKFVKTATVSSAGLMIPEVLWPAIQRRQIKGKPATNIKDALKFPRNENSMPGLFPGRVIQVIHPDSVVNQKPVESVAYEMIEQAICQLTDQKNLKKAWRKLVNRNDRIGLKINPVAVDRVGYDIVIKKRIEEGVQSRDNPRGKAFINMAGKLNLGESNLDQINWKRIEMG